MSTNIQPHHDEKPDGNAQSLLIWLGLATLVVTGLIIFGVTSMGVTAGVMLAYAGLILAVGFVLFYIIKFIGPEDH